MKKIIYTRPDGGLSVVHPIINTHPVPEDITEEQALQRAWDKLPADAISPQVVDASSIPTDRTFREAWVASADTGCTVDMDKAREIQRDLLRRERAPLFQEADVAFFKALEAWIATQADVPAELTDAIAQKQALRDVTADPSIEAAETPDELKTVYAKVR